MTEQEIKERIADLEAMQEEILENIRGLHYHDIEAKDQWALIDIKDELEELRGF